MAATKALRVGLTGGIGSGKSAVATLLQELGATVVDTDLIARQITAPGGAAIPAIAAAFGAGFIGADGALDRARMRALAFADAPAKRRLEAILHPLIGCIAEDQAAASPAPAIVFDIPLLVESGRWLALVDRVWVVDCPESVQIERVTARSGWPVATVAAVISQQVSRASRRSHADAVLYNAGIGLSELRSEVRALWQATVSAPA